MTEAETPKHFYSSQVTPVVRPAPGRSAVPGLGTMSDSITWFESIEVKSLDQTVNWGTGERGS